MAKKTKTPAPKPVEFPKTLLVAYSDHGTEDEYLFTGKTPKELQELAGALGDTTVKIARYMLVGTGTIHNDGPYYVEDAQP